MTIYTVLPGDSIYSIADTFGVPPSLIISENELENAGSLVVGQTLVIRVPSVVYTVREGDTLASIAAAYGTNEFALYRNNPSLGGVDVIYPGQTLVISYPPPQNGEIAVNGYIYPYIDLDVLRKTLPYLSYLTIFTYGINRDGTLIPPGDEAREAEIIALARQYRVMPIMLLSTLTSEGTFSNELAAYIFENPDVRGAIVENLVNTLISKGYAGIDLDFEYIEPQYADDYADFVRDINSELDLRGDYIVFVALAPKVRADQPGLLYEGHSYPDLADAADKVLLMTYEWGYTYGPPMAVAPINEVRRVVDYALTEMSPDKIMLGIPNYGYDWLLPYVRGVSRAMSLSNVEAVRRAGEFGVRISFDELAMSPFYEYSNENDLGEVRNHIVWFEDARSVAAKLNLISEYGLFGGSVWNIMRYFPALWLVLSGTFSIMRPGET